MIRKIEFAYIDDVFCVAADAEKCSIRKRPLVALGLASLRLLLFWAGFLNYPRQVACWLRLLCPLILRRAAAAAGKKEEKKELKASSSSDRKSCWDEENYCCCFRNSQSSKHSNNWKIDDHYFRQSKPKLATNQQEFQFYNIIVPPSKLAGQLIS